MKEKSIRIFQIGILIVNIVSVMFISYFIWSTTKLICRRYDASRFLQGVNAIPWDPQKVLWMCVILLGN